MLQANLGTGHLTRACAAAQLVRQLKALRQASGT
jgi:hypothetical protein